MFNDRLMLKSNVNRNKKKDRNGTIREKCKYLSADNSDDLFN